MKIIIPARAVPYQGDHNAARSGFRFVPARVRKWKALVANCAKIAAKNEPVTLSEDDSYRVEIVYQFKAPDVLLRRLERGKIDALPPKISRPDITDNLNKATVDALRGIAIYDDANITQFSARKVYGKSDNVEILITSAKEAQ